MAERFKNILLLNTFHMELMWINWITKIKLIEFIEIYYDHHVKIQKKPSCVSQKLESSTWIQISSYIIQLILYYKINVYNCNTINKA